MYNNQSGSSNSIG